MNNILSYFYKIIFAILLLCSSCSNNTPDEYLWKHVTATTTSDNKILKAIVEKKANIESRKNNQTPLMYACKRNNFPLARQLIYLGANVNADDSKDNCLTYACINGNYQLVKLLIKSGINIDFLSCHGWTPLSLACSFGKEKCVSVLIQEGANIDFPATDFNPLIVACREGETGIVQILLEKGANMNIKDSKGDTPIEIARKNNRKGTLKLLKDKDTDPLSPSKSSSGWKRDRKITDPNPGKVK